jgi:hypothetical protein
MPELTLQNIEEISRDVRRHEITFSHLASELIDHICCDVEDEMRKGVGFREAYAIIRKKLGVRGLEEIQEETLYAVDTKYRQMKNTMKISGIAGTVLLGFAALFKIMHWPWAGILMMLGALSLAFIFMPSALTVLWKETHNAKRIFLYISAFVAGMSFIMGVVFKVQHWPYAAVILSLSGVAAILGLIPAFLVIRMRDPERKNKRIAYLTGTAGLVFYISGILFKIQHWPGGSALLTGGIIVFLLVAFPWYTWVTWKDERNVSARFIFMVVGSLAIVVPGVLLNLSLQRNYEEGYYRQVNEQQAMVAYLIADNRNFAAECTDTTVAKALTDINLKTDDLLNVISRIETQLVAISEGKPGRPAVITETDTDYANGKWIQYSLLKQPFSNVPFNDFMSDRAGLHSTLDEGLAGYARYLSGLVQTEDFGKYLKLLEPSVYNPGRDPATSQVSLMSWLHTLELMKTGVLTVESYVLSVVYNNNNQ